MVLHATIIFTPQATRNPSLIRILPPQHLLRLSVTTHQTEFYFSPPSALLDGTASVRCLPSLSACLSFAERRISRIFDGGLFTLREHYS